MKRRLVFIMMISIFLFSFVSVLAVDRNSPPADFDTFAKYSTNSVNKDIVIGKFPPSGTNSNNYPYHVTSFVYRSFFTTKIDKDWYLQIHYFGQNNFAGKVLEGPKSINTYPNISNYLSFKWPYNYTVGMDVSVEYYKYNSYTRRYEFYRYGNDPNLWLQEDAIVGQYLISNWSNITIPTPVTSSIMDNWDPVGTSGTGWMTSSALPQFTITAEALSNGKISPVGSKRVDQGGSMTFEITPNKGYQLDQLFINGSAITYDPGNSYTFTNVQSNQTIKATFKATKKYPVTVTQTPGGTITPGGGQIEEGSSQTYHFTPQPGYKIKDVKINGVSKGAITEYTVSSADGAVDIQVEFEKSKYTINATTTNGGIADPPGVTEYEYGSNVKIVFTAEDGYSLDKIYLNGALYDSGSAGVSPYIFTFYGLDRSQTIHATYKKKTYESTVTQTPGGTVTPGSGQIEHGSSKTYYFTPQPGYKIKDVKVNGASKGAIDEYTVTDADGDVNIQVEFEKIKYAITSSATGSGVVAPDGVTVVEHGSSQLYNFTPRNGFTVKDVIVDGVSLGALPYYRFTDIQDNHSINVIYDEIPLNSFTITSLTGTGGTIDPFGVSVFQKGESQTYTITPETGRTVKDVKVDGVSVGAVTSYVFSDIQSNHTISVEFNLRKFTIVASSGGNGVIFPVGSIEVEEGSDYTFIFTPNRGYIVNNVNVDGVGVGTMSSFTFYKVSGNHIIYVDFKITESTFPEMPDIPIVDPGDLPPIKVPDDIVIDWFNPGDYIEEFNPDPALPGGITEINPDPALPGGITEINPDPALPGGITEINPDPALPGGITEINPDPALPGGLTEINPNPSVPGGLTEFSPLFQGMITPLYPGKPKDIKK